MASGSPMNSSGPSTHSHVTYSHVPTEPNTYVPDLGSQESMIQEAHDQAAQWQLQASWLERALKEARDYSEGIEDELESTKLQLQSALMQRPSFDERTQEIVPRNFVARSLKQQQEIQELKKEINENTKKHDSVVSLWQDALEELEEAKLSKKYLAIDDDAMASKWKQLQFIIKNLGTSYLCGLATSNITHLTPEVISRHQQLMPISNEEVTESKFIWFCQILIWDFITTKILMVPTVVWGRDVCNSVERLFNMVQSGDRVPASEFHAFRAHVGEILNASTDIDATICRNLKSELKDQLQPFIAQENKEQVIRQLDNIVDKAVDLATIFIQSRCFYHIRTMDRHLKRLFVPETMENFSGHDGPYVYATISPVLLKYGNSKGENYGERIILAKAGVLCYHA